MPSKKGKIIILNGASSSGKTATAKELQKLLRNYEYFPIDKYSSNWVKTHPEIIQKLQEEAETLGPNNWKIREELENKSVLEYQKLLREKAQSGTNLIADYVLWKQRLSKNCAKLLRPYNVLFVGLDCPINILEKREEARKNRLSGLAAKHALTVHKGKRYDIRLPTDRMNPQKCATTIFEYIQKRDLEKEPSVPQKLNSDDS